MIDEKITFKQINIAVITLSDTRKESDDKSGNTLKELIQKKGHSVSHYQIIEDEPKLFIPIIQKLTASIEHDVIITSGGTGLTGRDNTIDALKKISQVEIPGCSLCMGNQARAADGATMVSTSTRNFPNRMGDGCNVYLASSEVTAISSLLGKIPTREEYVEYMQELNTMSSEVFRYMNFNEIEDYLKKVRNLDIAHLDIEEIKS